jgi:hypothetical protein
MSERMFPVLLQGSLQRRLFIQRDCPLDVPWSLVAPHEEQALRNHGQTLERLAERGGLSPAELVAVLEDQRWKAMTVEAAVARLLELVSK